MEKITFSDLLSDKLNIREINSKTLAYRVNGLIYALNLNLDKDKCIKSLQQYEDVYATGLIYNQSTDDEITVYAVKKQSKNLGDYIHIVGESDDLSFAFDNYYENRNIDKRILEIPFNIFINKIYDGMEYMLSIKSTIDKQVRFSFLEEDGHEIHFYANILDFSKILNIIKSFVNNPEEVIRVYEDVLNKKKIVFNNGELNKVIDYDEKLEKPANGFVKKINMITNNEGIYRKK